MSDEQTMQIQKLSAALNVSGNTIKALEKKVADASKIIAILEGEKRAWTQERQLQGKIMQQQLSVYDDKVRQLQDEIMELRKQLKAKAA